MDLLSGVSLEGFRIGIWLIAIVLGVIFFFLGFRSNYKERIWSVVRGLLAAALAFAAGSLAVMFYLISHPTDPRWSEGGTPMLNPDEVPSNPIFGGLIDAFNDVQGTVTDTANNVIAIDNTLKKLPEFFEMFLWGASIAAVLGVAMAIISFVIGKLTRIRLTKLERRADKQRDAIHDLQRERGFDPSPDL